MGRFCCFSNILWLFLVFGTDAHPPRVKIVLFSKGPYYVWNYIYIALINLASSIKI